MKFKFDRSRKWILSPLVVSLFGLTILGVVLAAGRPVISFLSLRFNDVIRADAAALTQAQEYGTDPLFFNDGYTNTDQVLSQLYVSVPQLNSLRQSKCFYTEALPPTLSWELFIGGLSFRDEDGDPATANIDQIGLCKQADNKNGYYGHPHTREKLSVNVSGNIWNLENNALSIQSLFSGPPNPDTLAIQVCTDGTAKTSKYDGCGVLDKQCVFLDARQFCALEIPSAGHEDGALHNEISCNFRCEMPNWKRYARHHQGDTSYSLREAVGQDLTNPNAVTRSNAPLAVHTLEPNLKVVQGSRLFIRPLTYKGDEKDAQGNKISVWSWAVQEMQGPGGIVNEVNFSPNLFINTVKVFQEPKNADDRRSPQKQYLTPAFIRVNGEKCEPEEGTNRFVLDDCGIAATPTYLVRDPSHNIEWEIGFLAANVPNQPLYYEAEVMEARLKASQSLDVVAKPGRLDFGYRPITKKRDLTFSLVNLATSLVDIKRIYLTNVHRVGYDSTRDYSLNGQQSPFKLLPGEKQDFVLTATPASLDTSSIYVNIEPQRGRATRTLQVAAHITPIDSNLAAQASVLTSTRTAEIDFTIPSGSFRGAAVSGATSASFVRNFLIANNGYQDLILQNLRLEGAGAAAYGLEGRDPRTHSSETITPTSSFTIAPGESHDFILRYNTTNLAPGSGPHSAIFRADATNDPQTPVIEVPIVGDYR